MYNANTVNSYMTFALCVVLFIAVLAAMDLRADRGMPAGRPKLNVFILWHIRYISRRFSLSKFSLSALILLIIVLAASACGQAPTSVRTQPPTLHRRGITKFNQTSYLKTKRG